METFASDRLGGRRSSRLHPGDPRNSSKSTPELLVISGGIGGFSLRDMPVVWNSFRDKTARKAGSRIQTPFIALFVCTRSKDDARGSSVSILGRFCLGCSERRLRISGIK